MKTDIIRINSDLQGHDAATHTAEKFAEYNDITGKTAMHIRLLTEETLSMVHGILDDFSGKFWLESEQTRKGMLCRICLSAEKQANKEQEAHILSVSSSGRNENVKGVMGRIRELFRRSLQCADAEEEEFLHKMNDTLGNSGFPSHDTNYWSLQVYRQEISAKKETSQEEWDELEKSIITKLADDVKVWLNTDSTMLVIEKYIK